MASQPGQIGQKTSPFEIKYLYRTPPFYQCTLCGAQLRPVHSDLPFKVSEQTIVILKDLPVLQCENCAQYLLEDRVISRVDEILASIDSAAELEIIRYVA